VKQLTTKSLVLAMTLCLTQTASAQTEWTSSQAIKVQMSALNNTAIDGAAYPCIAGRK
jgi:hypothetical protein